MGDEQGQGGVTALVFFLDENHCRNPHMIAAIEESGFVCEKHLDHFRTASRISSGYPSSRFVAGL